MSARDRIRPLRPGVAEGGWGWWGMGGRDPCARAAIRFHRPADGRDDL